MANPGMSSTTGGTVGVGAGVHRAAAQLQGGPRFAGHKNWGRSFGDRGLCWIYLYLLWFINQLITGGAPPCWAWYKSVDIAQYKEQQKNCDGKRY